MSETSDSCLGVLVLPFPASSQQTPDQRALREAVLPLNMGQEIRLSARPWGMLDGRLWLKSRDSLQIAARGERWSVPLSSIDTLWVKQNAVDKAMATGTVVGGTVGGVLSYLLGDTYCRPGSG